MTTRALGGRSGVALVLAAWALAEPVAHAAVTCDGRVCPEGFTCETATSTCAADDPGCEVFTETYCKSPPCAVDGDCPQGRRCKVETLSCDPPPSGAGGGVSTPPDCTPRTESWCRLSYEMECESDAQCGAGFTCRPVDDCDCSNPEAPVPPGCSCELAEIKGCYTPVVACTAATARTDCPEGWSCIDNEKGLCNDIGDLRTGCRPGEPPRVCVPPGFDAVASTVDLGSEPTNGATDADFDTDSGGDGACSVVAGTSRSGAGGLVLAVALGLGLRRRRRVS